MRYLFAFPVTDRSGNAIEKARVTAFAPDRVSVPQGDVFTTEDGAELVEWPLLTDPDGMAYAWFEIPQSLEVLTDDNDNTAHIGGRPSLLVSFDGDEWTRHYVIPSPEDIQAFIDQAVAALVDAAPGTLDTLNELAAALQDNPDVITDILDILATKAAQTDVDTLQADMDAANEALDAKADTSLVPSIEELQFSTMLNAGTVASTYSLSFYVAQFPQKVAAASVMVMTNLAASNTDYWTVAIRKFVNGNSVGSMVAKTTQSTGGGGLTANKDWNFDAETWDEDLRTLAKGDVLNLQLSETGAASNFDRFSISLRIEPL